MGIEDLVIANGSLWERLLDGGEELAKHSICKRKGVCVTLYHLQSQLPVVRTTNGPLPLDQKNPDHCSGEVGNCGCAHAELLASMWLQMNFRLDGIVLVGSYSPCATCANAIILTDRIVGCVYLHETENYTDGKHILERNNIPVLQLHVCDFRATDDHLRN